MLSVARALLTVMFMAMSAAAVDDPFADHAAASDDSAALNRVRRILSPRIEGDVLVIEGKIDSHIYDYLQYEAAKVAAVRVIELDSLGGNVEWALAIAHKVKDLGKTTLIRSGSYCASACAYIFAAGRERIAYEDTWIGIHGARLGAGYLANFQGLCFVDRENGSDFEPGKAGCQEFLNHWYEIALASTNEAFDIMESNGVSPDLRTDLFRHARRSTMAGSNERHPQTRLAAQRSRRLEVQLGDQAAAKDQFLSAPSPARGRGLG